jgi:hypothetical protein
MKKKSGNESWSNPCEGDSVENFKRRRSLPAFSVLDMSSIHFFDRILSIKKDRELIFIPKQHARGR